MTLDELQRQAEKDLKMDDLELSDESLKTASLHQKYLSIHSNFKQLQIIAEANYRVLYRKKWEYYGGKSDPKVYRDTPFDHKILKQDLPIYLESDEELIKAKQKIEYNKMCVEYCERTLKMISSRDWQIRNSIEWRKFVDGNV
jgi:hypothetical protein